MSSATSEILTFLFTDVEGSTQLWEHSPQAMRRALQRHDELLRGLITAHGGHTFKTTGDAFYAAFAFAPAALAAAFAIHRALLAEPWQDIAPLRVRIGLHSGTAEARDNDYFGPTLNRAARLHSIGHGQQTLLSQAAYDLTCNNLPAGVFLRDMGRHALKDLGEEQVWQAWQTDLPSEFPPLRSLRVQATNLPAQLTSFVGREQEMAYVGQRLKAARLITLVGAGGTGKTRLAMQAGAAALEQYPDGVWLVEMAALTDGVLLPSLVLSALNLREEPGRAALATLTEYVKSRKLLLILDNCEHLIQASAGLADTLLRTAPGLRALATSREPLNIAGEQVWRVPSLEAPPAFLTRAGLTPAEAQDAWGDKNIAAAILEYDAVRLFVERARAQRADFAVTTQNALYVARLCARLDGIPLAIELAAARARSLPVEQIEARLDDRFRLLTGGSRAALPRQQTLRALIDWSYDLLDDRERALYARLSVFAGGFDLAAAEAVCASAPTEAMGAAGASAPTNALQAVGASAPGEDCDIEDWEMLDLLTSLADKSLALADTAGPDGETRYGMLESIRQYGADRLREAGQTDALGRRHRDYFLALAQAGEPHLTGARQAEWLARLDREHDNLRAALAFSLRAEQDQQNQQKNQQKSQQTEQNDQSEQDAQAGLRLAGALARFWWMRGYLDEGRGHLQAALNARHAQTPTAARAGALSGAGVIAQRLDDLEQAQAWHEQCLAIRQTLGDQDGIAATLNNMGEVARLRADYARARELYAQALAIRRETTNTEGMSACLSNLGMLDWLQGDLAAAQSHYEESLAILRAAGDQSSIGLALDSLGVVAHEQGNWARARDLKTQALTIARQMGSVSDVATSLNNLSATLIEQGERDEARTMLEEALRLYRASDDSRGLRIALVSLAGLLVSLGELRAARAHSQECLALCRRHEDRLVSLYALIDCAMQAQAQQRTEQAAALCGAAEGLRAALGVSLGNSARLEMDSLQFQARSGLGEADFERAWTQGQALTWEQCLDFVLNALPPP